MTDDARHPPMETVRRMATAVGVPMMLALAGCGGSASVDELLPVFQTGLARVADDAGGDAGDTVTGVDGWQFSAAELRHVSADRPPAEGGAVSAILNLQRQLETLGVDLLVVPVPPKAIVFPEKVAADIAIPIPVPRLDPEHEALYERLRAQCVDVLDLTRLFIRERFHPEGPLYCRTDSHWSGTGCIVAASAIAEEVLGRSWFDDLDTERFGFVWYSTTVTGNLLEHDGTEPTAREELRLRAIVRNTADGPKPPPPDPTSPIVLLGDSHTLVFHAGADLHATGAGLPEQLAFAIGVPVDLVAARSSAAALTALAARVKADDDYWSHKRLVIWCFSAGEFSTSDDYPFVPLSR